MRVTASRSSTPSIKVHTFFLSPDLAEHLTAGVARRFYEAMVIK
jgi:hypothetical protein